jgi:hypothetical protein
MGRGPWSQAERDGITVEIGYALFNAALLGALVLAAIAGPAAVWHLPHPVEDLLVRTGAVAAGLLAVLRVVHVLRGHARHLREQR